MRSANINGRIFGEATTMAPGPEVVLRALERAKYLREFVSRRTNILKTLKASKWASQHEIDALEYEIDNAQKELQRQERAAMTFDLVR